eukprot:3941712-Rhodomonas_salina.3
MFDANRARDLVTRRQTRGVTTRDHTHVKSHAYGCVHQSAIASSIRGVTPGCVRGESEELWYGDVTTVTDPWHSDVQPIVRSVVG